MKEWNDELLRWDPKDFGGLEMIRIPCERIWLPDITCQLKLGSWTYNGFEVDVTNRTDEIDLNNYVKNGEWDLLRADIMRNVVVYPCCTEPFPDVTITLVIRRKTLYYIYNIVLPCMMLSVLTLLVFCLPPDSGEKIALGITVLLAFSVFMLAISEALPETSESIPLIGIYLTVVMAITSISVIVTVVVLNLHYLGPRVRPVPAWLNRRLNVMLLSNYPKLRRRYTNPLFLAQTRT
ncbi:Neuronal acetylcholine receptor subunit alpha-10 [Orchesella cincta]|uniref:Neuronal acetylcholine receptor subunit alpha-10 n=1 Tax=Orchesella cincta TaxID=48709 RepID=A0A1D2N1A8_ORCCI|nr:Neuronal acetylcholine receptor subunit alpha-10 [Orchesella cincta]